MWIWVQYATLMEHGEAKAQHLYYSGVVHSGMLSRVGCHTATHRERRLQIQVELRCQPSRVFQCCTLHFVNLLKSILKSIMPYSILPLPRRTRHGHHNRCNYTVERTSRLHPVLGLPPALSFESRLGPGMCASPGMDSTVTYPQPGLRSSEDPECPAKHRVTSEPRSTGKPL